MNWPSDWMNKALTAAGEPVTSDRLAIMRAWKQSTPLSPYSNNPIGMPAGTSGTKAYAGTQYAAFTSMAKFYKAFGTWSTSAAGRAVISAMTDPSAYAASWRAISALGWPGSQTETDYPAALLDLTADSYRASVQSSDPATRKTSGVVAVNTHVKAVVLAHNQSIADAARSALSTRDAVAALLRRHGNDGNWLLNRQPGT